MAVMWSSGDDVAGELQRLGDESTEVIAGDAIHHSASLTVCRDEAGQPEPAQML
jgi:hypothetical protein